MGCGTSSASSSGVAVDEGHHDVTSGTGHTRMVSVDNGTPADEPSAVDERKQPHQQKQTSPLLGPASPERASETGAAPVPAEFDVAAMQAKLDALISPGTLRSMLQAMFR